MAGLGGRIARASTKTAKMAGRVSSAAKAPSDAIFRPLTPPTDLWCCAGSTGSAVEAASLVSSIIFSPGTARAESSPVTAGTQGPGGTFEHDKDKDLAVKVEALAVRGARPASMVGQILSHALWATGAELSSAPHSVPLHGGVHANCAEPIPCTACFSQPLLPLYSGG